jgi:hypothetical protein
MVARGIKKKYKKYNEGMVLRFSEIELNLLNKCDGLMNKSGDFVIKNKNR